MLYILEATHETERSTLTPGLYGSVVKRAKVEIVSTIVAVIPPCKVPPRFVCSSLTFILHTHLPSAAETTST